VSLNVNPEYQLLATPCLITEGQYKGQLKGILFVAQSQARKMQWFAVNCGQFETAFRELIPDAQVHQLIEDLMRGEEIRFPGSYRLEQFDGGFHFAWWQPQHRFRPPSPDTNGHFLWGV
jgi:hypothetical protein